MKQEQEQQEARRYLTQAGVVESGKGYLNVQEVSQYLNMKTSAVYAWAQEMPHYKIGNLLRFKKEDIDAWMETKKAGAEVHKAGIRRAKNSIDVANIVRKTIDAAKTKSYNSSGKSDPVKGLRKEVRNGII